VSGVGRQAERNELGGCQARIEGRLLRHVGNACAGLLGALAAVELGQPGKSTQERRLAASIAADEAHAVATRNCHRHVTKRRPSAKGDVSVL